MKRPKPAHANGGFTLIELTVTIAVILVLAGIVGINVGPYTAYRDGRIAGEALRSVKAAQLLYLADNPSTPITTLTQAILLPYLPNGAWPALPSVGTQTPTILCNQFPPVATLGTTAYDPSPTTTDGLWDVGKY